jgi:hypothetical protein
MANDSKSQSVVRVRDSGGEFFRSYPQLWDEAGGSTQAELFSGFNDEQRANAEKQILEHQRIVDYDTKEYPVETVVAKYLARKRDDDNELFVPDYQRDFTWSINRQSKFIESMLIGLPIPYIFVADVTEKEARLEIVDGSQRIRTLAAFITNQLILEGLEKLSNLNGFKFCDLEVVRQRRFLRRTIHMIELSEEADEAVRRDVFERINTGSDVLRDMEVRRGLKSGPFLDLIESCASNALFKELAPLSEYSERRREREEFVLRFFAYLENYNNFDKRVREFLDDYMAQTQVGFNETRAGELRAAFMQMLQFVQQNFPYGFRKAKNHVRTPRIRFEAISVGVALALRQNPQLKVKSLDWLDSDEFKVHTTSDASNSRPKVIGRIEFVRNQLLAQQ